MTKICESH